MSKSVFQDQHGAGPLANMYP